MVVKAKQIPWQSSVTWSKETTTRMDHSSVNTSTQPLPFVRLRIPPVQQAQRSHPLSSKSLNGDHSLQSRPQSPLSWKGCASALLFLLFTLATFHSSQAPLRCIRLDARLEIGESFVCVSETFLIALYHLAPSLTFFFLFMAPRLLDAAYHIFFSKWTFSMLLHASRVR